MIILFYSPVLWEIQYMILVHCRAAMQQWCKSLSLDTLGASCNITASSSALHFTLPHCIALICFVLHFAALHFIMLHCILLDWTALHWPVLYYIVLYYTALHSAQSCTANVELHYTGQSRVAKFISFYTNQIFCQTLWPKKVCDFQVHQICNKTLYVTKYNKYYENV